MPLGIVSEEDFEREINSYNNPGSVTTTIMERGRGNVKEVPEVLREVIAEEAILGDNKSTAEAFGVSQSSVSAYMRGVTSTANYNSKKKAVTARERIAQRAQSKVMAALRNITPDKLANVEKVTDLATIAKDMANVFDKLSPKDKTEEKPQVHVHFYRPEQKQIDDYEVIDVTPASAE